MVTANQKGAKVSSSIFREYDIRGQASPGPGSEDLTLTTDAARLIGQALGSRHVEQSKALVTGDNRLSTPVLRNALAEGLQMAGMNVDVAVDEMPTGGASWLALAHEYDVVVQVTGSHTPPHFNGLKITQRQRNGEPSSESGAMPTALYGRGLATLYDDIMAGKLRHAKTSCAIAQIHGMTKQYQNALIQAAKTLLPTGGFKYPKRVVLDSGNGLGSVLKEVLEKLGVEVDGLFLDSDGRFPNHPADPLLTRTDVPYNESGVRYACERVSDLNRRDSDGAKWIGIVTDGDGDRTGMVDEIGRPVRPEVLGIIFCSKYLQQNIEALRLLESQGQRLDLALDVRGTAIFNEIIQTFPGVRGRFIPAGYPLHRAFARTQVQHLMSLQDSLKKARSDYKFLEGLVRNYCSAEISGHYFFNITPEHPEILVDDGLLSALKLLRIIDIAQDIGTPNQLTEAPLASLVGTVPHRFTSEELRLRCPDDKKFGIVEQVRLEAQARFSDEILPISPVEVQDGLQTQSPESGLIIVDGVRVQFRDRSFLLIRASNTSAMLTFRFEGGTPEVLARRYCDARALLQPFKAFIDGLDSLASDLSLPNY